MKKGTTQYWLDQWGFDIPDGYDRRLFKSSHKKTLDTWVDEFNMVKRPKALIFENIKASTLNTVYYVVESLVSRGKIKSKIGRINLADIISVPQYSQEQKDIVAETIKLIEVSNLIVLEDFDFMLDDNNFKTRTHWVLNTCLAKKVPIILLLTGSIDDIMDSVSKLTLLKLSNHSWVINE